MSQKPRNPKNPQDPFGDTMFFSEDLGDLFETHRPYGRSETGFITTRSFNPAADIHECPDGFIITLEVPGMNREEVDLELVDHTLIVSGSRTFVKENEREEHIRLERGFGSFKRSFEIPGAIDSGKIEASLDSGILSIRIPRLRESRSITVETED